MNFKKQIVNFSLKFSVFALVLLLAYSCEDSETQTVTTLTTLVWEDDFNSDGIPDSNNWGYEIGDGTAQGIPGWGNNELQYYRSQNTTVANGYCIIEAKQENFSGANYTSSRMITKGAKDFKYGRIDIRAGSDRM